MSGNFQGKHGRGNSIAWKAKKGEQKPRRQNSNLCRHLK